jgi:hypothetical protein
VQRDQVCSMQQAVTRATRDYGYADRRARIYEHLYMCELVWRVRRAATLTLWVDLSHEKCDSMLQSRWHVRSTSILNPTKTLCTRCALCNSVSNKRRQCMPSDVWRGGLQDAALVQFPPKKLDYKFLHAYGHMAIT